MTLSCFCSRQVAFVNEVLDGGVAKGVIAIGVDGAGEESEVETFLYLVSSLCAWNLSIAPRHFLEAGMGQVRN